MSEALEACPFCGSPAEHREDRGPHGNEGPGYYVACTACDCRTDSEYSESFADGVWNTRAALEQGESVEPWGWVAKVPGSSKIITHSSCSASRWADECGLEVIAVYTAPPSTAEIRVRELEGALRAFVDNSSIQANHPHECEQAEELLEKGNE